MSRKGGGLKCEGKKKVQHPPSFFTNQHTKSDISCFSMLVILRTPRHNTSHTPTPPTPALVCVSVTNTFLQLHFAARADSSGAGEYEGKGGEMLYSLLVTGSSGGERDGGDGEGGVSCSWARVSHGARAEMH